MLCVDCLNYNSVLREIVIIIFDTKLNILQFIIERTNKNT